MLGTQPDGPMIGMARFHLVGYPSDLKLLCLAIHSRFYGLQNVLAQQKRQVGFGYDRQFVEPRPVTDDHR